MSLVFTSIHIIIHYVVLTMFLCIVKHDSVLIATTAKTVERIVDGSSPGCIITSRIGPVPGVIYELRTAAPQNVTIFCTQ